MLKRYEQAKSINMHSYYAIDELVDLLSYFLFQEKCDEAEEVLKIARSIHPAAPENTKMEIKLMLSKGEPQRALELFGSIEYIDDNETKILHAEILLSLKDFKNAREIALDIIRKVDFKDSKTLILIAERAHKKNWEEEIEKWYDNIYNMWLLAKLSLANVPRNKEVKALLGKINQGHD